MSETLILRVTGMTCGGCENAVQRTLMKLGGIESVSASHVRQSVRVDYKRDSVTPEAIRAAIQTLGYDVQP
jgi:copper chaperone CopZ